MSEPTLAEQLAAERQRYHDAMLEIAQLTVEVELETAKEIAYRAAIQNNKLRDRVDELEQALGRRQRARRDDSLGLERLRMLEERRNGATAP